MVVEGHHQKVVAGGAVAADQFDTRLAALVGRGDSWPICTKARKGNPVAKFLQGIESKRSGTCPLDYRIESALLISTMEALTSALPWDACC